MKVELYWIIVLEAEQPLLHVSILTGTLSGLKKKGNIMTWLAEGCLTALKNEQYGRKEN